jgi:hypothetical protein
MNKSISFFLLSLLLIISLSITALADTIRLKDGSVIRGQVVGFRNQQFTVLVGAGARGGRRSRITIYMEDVESIDFDSATAANSSVDTTPPTDTSRNSTNAEPRPTSTASNPPITSPSTTRSSATSPFFTIRSRVRADNTSNGWTNTGLVVRRGQRLRISATGTVSLGNGRTSTPVGITTLYDKNKLMPNEATGALIAVIGDDNDDFIYIGRSRDFVAQRDGILFLGVNEGDLSDNSGAYDAIIEAEAVGSNSSSR